LIAQSKNVNGLVYQPFDWHKAGGKMGDSPPVLTTSEPDRPQSDTRYKEDVAIIWGAGRNTQEFIGTYRLPPFRISN
jgi:hypothetical protein